MSVLLLFVGLALAGAAYFWLRPLSVFETLGRLALGNAGLAKQQIAGPKGRLVYWQGGSGPTLALIHGANDQAGAWALIAPRLVKRYRLLLIDLPGHGDSAPADGPLTVGDLLSGIEAILDVEVPNEKLALGGNSLGGWLALLYAHRHPERVSQVVLINGAAVRGGGPEDPVNLLPTNREEARRAVAAVTAPGAPATPGFVLDDLVRRAPGSPLARLLESDFESYALDDRLHEVETPVSLVWGEADGIMPPSYAREVASGLPASRLELIPGCGHIPQRECPEALLSRLEDVLSNPPQPPASVPDEAKSEEE